MPIEVRHDVPAGITALASLMAGRGAAAAGEREAAREAGRLAVQLDAQQTRQSQELNARRGMQMAQIDAQADRQKEAADTAYARTALEAGLEGKIREQNFDNQMEALREEARAKANQFEYEFTTKDRQRIAKLNEGDQIMDDPRFSDADRNEWQRMKAQQLAGITPKPRPADPNKEIFPPGQGPRDIWSNEITGDYMGYDRNGNQVVRIPYEKTPEGRKETHEQNVELEELKARQKTREAMADYRKELLKERVPAAEEGEERPLQPNEVQERMEAAYPKEMAEEFQAFLQERQAAQQERQAPPDAELEQEPQRRVDARQGAMEQLQSWAQRMKVRPTEAEAGLPDEAALAQAFLRNANERIKKGEKIFPHITEAYDAALEILEGYNAQGNR